MKLTDPFFRSLALVSSLALLVGCGGQMTPPAAGKAGQSIEAAMTLLNQGKTLEAVGNLTEIIKSDPNNAEAFRVLGDIFFSKNEFDRAEAFYLRAVELKSTNGLLYDSLGQLAIKKGSAPAAVQYFLKASEINPRIPDPYYHLGILALASKETEAAINMFKKALAVDPNHVPTLGVVAQLEATAQQLEAKNSKAAS